ncbi:MAG: RluA family pseudouridine synthase [Ethanoligenens sp.]
MKAFTIGANDAGMRVDKFVAKVAPCLPKSLLYKYIRLKRIKVDGKRTAISQRLTVDSLVELYVNDEFFEAKAPTFLDAPTHVEILYEDENILIVDKKPGLVVHEDESGSPDTLIGRIQHLLYERGEYDPEQENSFAPALCNRIDRNTGGIVLAAKNAPALRILNEKIKVREVRKRYLCIMHGHLKEKNGTLTTYQVKDEAQKKVHVYDHPMPNGLTAVTKYHVLDEQGALSLLEVELVTGRTHQIRAAFAHIRHPLLGDSKYGDNECNRPYKLRYQALYAYQTTFAFSTDAGPLNYLKGKTFNVEEIWFARKTHSGFCIQDSLRR